MGLVINGSTKTGLLTVKLNGGSATVNSVTYGASGSRRLYKFYNSFYMEGYYIWVGTKTIKVSCDYPFPFGGKWSAKFYNSNNNKTVISNNGSIAAGGIFSWSSTSSSTSLYPAIELVVTYYINEAKSESRSVTYSHSLQGEVKTRTFTHSLEF